MKIERLEAIQVHDMITTTVNNETNKDLAGQRSMQPERHAGIDDERR